MDIHTITALALDMAGQDFDAMRDREKAVALSGGADFFACEWHGADILAFAVDAGLEPPTDADEFCAAVAAAYPNALRAIVAEEIETDAEDAAEDALAGRAPEASDWRAAGYASAMDAARAMVGDGYGRAVRERAAEIVARVLEAE